MMIFLLFLLTVSNNNIFSEKCIFRSWIHSHEDNDTKKVYRQSYYDFPPSRGRDEMEIKENGIIIFGNVNPRDSFEKNIGYFEIKEPNILNIFLNGNTMQLSINILSCEKDRLIIQKDSR